MGLKHQLILHRQIKICIGVRSGNCQKKAWGLKLQFIIVHKQPDFKKEGKYLRTNIDEDKINI